MSPSPIIAHLDMDAFFAAIEERGNPRWRGLPLVVGADPQEGSGRGVVSTANYPARRFGIHSAMPIKTAWRLAKAAEAKGEAATIFVSGSSFGNYSKTSQRIMRLLQETVPQVYQGSVDEAYLDISFTHSFSAAEDLCRRLQNKIFQQEKITGSFGLGPNKLVAKIASDFKKPQGLTVVEPGQVISFLAPLPLRRIPGVGPKAEESLKKAGLYTVGQAQRLAVDELKQILGQAWGESLFRKVRGQDNSPLRESAQARSISEQRTFPTDTRDPKQVMIKVEQLAQEVAQRVGTEGFKSFRTVTLMVRFADFKTVTRSHTTSEHLTSALALKQSTLRLLLPFFDQRENPQHKAFRLVGVRVAKLYSGSLSDGVRMKI